MTSIYDLIAAVRDHEKCVALCVFTTDDLGDIQDPPIADVAAVRKPVEEAMTATGWEALGNLAGAASP